VIVWARCAARWWLIFALEEHRCYNRHIQRRGHLAAPICGA
jgi:hypothetical protein